MRLGSRGIRVAVGFAAAAALVVACSSSPGDERIGKTSQAATSFPKATVDQLLSTGDFNDAFAAAQEFLATAPTDCDANYANLIATTMMVVDSINTYVLPGERNGPPPPAINQQLGTLYAERLELALQASQTVVTLGCTYDLARCRCSSATRRIRLSTERSAGCGRRAPRPCSARSTAPSSTTSRPSPIRSRSRCPTRGSPIRTCRRSWPR